jgi:hypothetical protein
MNIFFGQCEFQGRELINFLITGKLIGIMEQFLFLTILSFSYSKEKSRIIVQKTLLCA